MLSYILLPFPKRMPTKLILKTRNKVKFLLHLITYYMRSLVGIYMCPQVPQQTYKKLKMITCGSQFSPSNMWSPKSELRSSGLTTRALTHILPAHKQNVKKRQGDSRHADSEGRHQ